MRARALPVRAVTALTVACVACAASAACATVNHQGMILVPAGRTIAGSTPEEREQAYADATSSSGRDSARAGRWFEREEARHELTLPAFWLDRTLVTNDAYAQGLAATGRDGPSIDEAA